jgi:hypothetical protein
MTNGILKQIGHANLLPHLSASLMTDDPPARSEVVLGLLITLLDAHFMTTGDPKTTWTERRLSHQNVANGFMLALLLEELAIAGGPGTCADK